MVKLDELFESLQDEGIDFFTGVPDSLLNDFCLYLESNLPKNKHLMAANEGNAIGIAAGYHLASGKVPVVYMQNSGIGNATNPLLSLTHKDVYSIPLILLIGWRGDPNIKDHAQHKKQGELTPVLMSDMDIPYRILDQEGTVIGHFSWAHQKAKEQSSPVALIVKKDILARKNKSMEFPVDNRLNREEAISLVMDALGKDAIYMGTTGRATREVHEQVLAKGLGAGHEFENVGAMGHLSSVGLGLAASSDKTIVCFDGDAAAIMHMGSLATIGRYQPDNLWHIVLNNGVNESVGGQKSAGQFVNLTQVADACLYQNVGSSVESRDEILEAVKVLSKKEGPKFIEIHVRQGIRKDMPKLNIDHKEMKNQLIDINS